MFRLNRFVLIACLLLNTQTTSAQNIEVLRSGNKTLTSPSLETLESRYGSQKVVSVALPSMQQIEEIMTQPEARQKERERLTCLLGANIPQEIQEGKIIRLSGVEALHTTPRHSGGYVYDNQKFCQSWNEATYFNPSGLPLGPVHDFEGYILYRNFQNPTFDPADPWKGAMGRTRDVIHVDPTDELFFHAANRTCESFLTSPLTSASIGTHQTMRFYDEKSGGLILKANPGSVLLASPQTLLSPRPDMLLSASGFLDKYTAHGAKAAPLYQTIWDNHFNFCSPKSCVKGDEYNEVLLLPEKCEVAGVFLLGVDRDLSKIREVQGDFEASKPFYLMDFAEKNDLSLLHITP